MSQKGTPGNGASHARRRFFTQFQDTMLINAALAFNLSAYENRLFCLLAGLAGSDNIVLVPTHRLAEIMGIERTNFQRLIKQLEEKGIVAKVPGHGRVVYRMLNPEMVQKCGPAQTRRVFERWDYELRSDRNKATRKGQVWLKDTMLAFDRVTELLDEARNPTHPAKEPGEED